MLSEDSPNVPALPCPHRVPAVAHNRRHLLLTTLAEGNTTLRSVTLRSSSKLRPQALVNAVQLTPTLREMKLVGELFDLEMGAFVKFVEGAVDPPQEGRGDASASASAGGSGGGGGSTSGGGGGPNRLDSLELSNMEMNKLAWGALVSSIAQGARLERLAIRNIPFQPPPGANAGNEMATCLGASLARMQAAEDRARVHLRELTLESCGVHDDGAAQTKTSAADALSRNACVGTPPGAWQRAPVAPMRSEKVLCDLSRLPSPVIRRRQTAR